MKFRIVSLMMVGVLLFAVGCGQKCKCRFQEDDAEIRVNLITRKLVENVQQMQCKCGGQKTSAIDTKRLNALLDQASAMSKITAVYFHYATPTVDCWLDDEAGDKMDAALRDAREVINRNAILFDLEFNIDSDRYFEVFRQMNHLWVTEWHEYKVYVAALTNSFDDICKERIARLEGAEAKNIHMPLAPIGYEERIGMKAADYLEKMRLFWEQSRNGPQG